MSRKEFRYQIELIEYGYKRSVFEVLATSKSHAKDRLFDHQPHSDENSGVTLESSVFEPTDAEITYLERIRG